MDKSNIGSNWPLWLVVLALASSIGYFAVPKGATDSALELEAISRLNTVYRYFKDYAESHNGDLPISPEHLFEELDDEDAKQLVRHLLTEYPRPGGLGLDYDFADGSLTANPSGLLLCTKTSIKRDGGQYRVALLRNGEIAFLPAFPR